MPIQTYTIEMKAEVVDGAEDALIDLTKQYARELLASASLVCAGGKVPLVIARTSDAFYNAEEIEVIDPVEYPGIGSS